MTARRHEARPVLVGLIALLPMIAPARAQERVPDGFEVATFAGGFSEPLALAVAPDGRVFVGEKEGTIWTVDAVSGERTAFAELEVYTVGECGLLGLALDPDFDSNGHVYVFATLTDNEQAVLRLTDAGGVGSRRTTIRGGLPTTGLIHNGGGLRVGPDRKLYFAIGDTGQPELSQELHTLAGKVCRLDLDGNVPADNPFVTPTGTPRAIYALGLRNPFRFCFAPDGRLLVMDVGSSGDVRREEINIMPAGSNGGWPLVEGFGAASVEGMLVQPAVAYRDEGAAIGGCVVYDRQQFPERYRGGLFHVDFMSKTIFHMPLDGTQAFEHESFGETASGPVDLVIAPDGGLLYTELFSGNVKHIAYPEGISDGPTLNAEVDPPAEPAGAPTLCGSGAALAVLPLVGLWINRRTFLL